MKLEVLWLTTPLILDPRRRWWASVAGYALLLLTLFFFARVTSLLMQEPRGAPVAESALTWTDAEWRFGTKELGGGEVQHYLFDGNQRITLCRSTAVSCRRVLFPQMPDCREMADSRINGLEDAQAKCNQLAGRLRFSGRFNVGHLRDEASVVRKPTARAARNEKPLFSRALVRPNPNERGLVLLTMTMFAMTVACAYWFVKHAIPRLMLAWAQYQGVRVKHSLRCQKERTRPRTRGALRSPAEES